MFAATSSSGSSSILIIYVVVFGGIYFFYLRPRRKKQAAARAEARVTEIGVRYQTIGGYVLHHLGHIPAEGEQFQQDGFRFEIVDMDRQRIDKLLVSRDPVSLPDRETAE